MENICKLCCQNEATQKNSHIFPRFFKKNYLKTNKSFHYYDISKQKSEKVVQDLPKEDYTFCPDCERRFQTLEHYASLYLNNSFKKSKEYSISKNHSDCQLALNCNPKILTLFVYSLIWRAHISTDKVFKDFILPDNCEKNLRETLFEIVPPKITELPNRLYLLKNQRWNYIFLKPTNKKGIYHVINYNDNIKKKGLAFMHTFEYAIIFILNRKAIPEKFDDYVNKKFETIKFLMMKKERWNSTILNITQLMIENYK